MQAMLKTKGTKTISAPKLVPRERGVVVDSFLFGLSALISVSGSSAFSFQAHTRHRSVNIALGSDFARIGNDMKRAISKEREIEKTSS
jgi:hypothetical protein